jgi:osmotically-inducible protein OsmY
MKTFRLLLLVLFPVLAAPLLQGCVGVAAVGAGAAVLSYQDRRTSGVQIDDEGIELRASNRVSERFGDKAHINITAFNRSVLLTGEVPDAKARDEVEKIVRGLPNVRGVVNDLKVAPPTPYESRAADAGITGRVKSRFLDAQKFSALHVKVVTEAGVVYLVGIVTETEAAEATELARTTGSVRRVVKVFEYCKPTDAICAPPAAAEPAKDAKTKDAKK